MFCVGGFPAVLPQRAPLAHATFAPTRHSRRLGRWTRGARCRRRTRLAVASLSPVHRAVHRSTVGEQVGAAQRPSSAGSPASACPYPCYLFSPESSARRLHTRTWWQGIIVGVRPGAGEPAAGCFRPCRRHVRPARRLWGRRHVPGWHDGRAAATGAAAAGRWRRGGVPVLWGGGGPADGAERPVHGAAARWAAAAWYVRWGWAEGGRVFSPWPCCLDYRGGGTPREPGYSLGQLVFFFSSACVEAWRVGESCAFDTLFGGGALRACVCFTAMGGC